MSTILDALEKIEKAKQGPGGGVRAQVLAGSPRPLSQAPPRRSLLWTAGVGFLALGLVVGVWLTRQEERSSTEGGTPLQRLSRAADERPSPLPVTPENSEASGHVVSTVTEGQAQAERQGTGRGAAPVLPEQPLALSEPPSVQDSPFVSLPQVEVRPSLVDATPQEFSTPGGGKGGQKWETPQGGEDSLPRMAESADGGGETAPEQGEGEQAEEVERPEQRIPQRAVNTAEPDESEDFYAAAPANSVISFLQWSPEPARRKAFIKVGGSPLTLVHEGDAVGGYTVVEIQPAAIALRSGATRFQLRVR